MPELKITGLRNLRKSGQFNQQNLEILREKQDVYKLQVNLNYGCELS